MTHALKTWPQYWDDISKGVKTFELRKDDRPYKVGDGLILQEYAVNGGYTGNEIKKTITYILRDCPGFGLKEGYCIIGFKTTLL